MQFHKRIRLDENLYRISGQPCSVTFGTQGHKPVFTNKEFANSSIKFLINYSTKHSIPLYICCIMPDHIHVLLEATKDKNIIEIIREIKSLLTKTSWEHGFHGSIFQKSFYDHFLRADEDILVVVLYILNNPVRAGIVDAWKNYPYIGSTVYSLDDLGESGG